MEGEQDLGPGSFGLHETDRWPGAYWVTFELGSRRYVVSRRNKPRAGWERLERVFIDIGARALARRRASEECAPEALALFRGRGGVRDDRVPPADDWVALALCRKALEDALAAGSPSEAAERLAAGMGMQPAMGFAEAFERVFLPKSRATEGDFHASAADLDSDLAERFAGWAEELERVRCPAVGREP